MVHSVSTPGRGGLTSGDSPSDAGIAPARRTSERETSEHALANTYRRPSFVAGYGRPSLLASSPVPKSHLAQAEIDELDNEERSLIRESQQQYHQHNKHGYGTSSSKVIEETREDMGEAASSEESTPLLADAPLSVKWNKAVEDQTITSSYRHETKVLASYSAPLIITFLLQSSEQFSTVFSLGHLGTIELGASSLSTMLAAITGFSVFQGKPLVVLYKLI